MRKYELDEYTVLLDLNNGVFKVLRHGAEWRDLRGDKFILALLDKIDELEEAE